MQPSPLLEGDAATALNLPTYAETRDSGVEWLGDVPAHWEVRRIKDWLRVNQTVLPEDTDPDYEFRYIDIGAVQAGVLVGEPVRMRFGASPSRARRVLRGGDTIVSTVRTYLKAVWHVPTGGDDLVASTGFAVLTPQAATEPAFVGTLCRSQPFADRVMAQSVGVAYPAIAETRLSAVPVAIPPPEEQRAIVRFLDYLDRRIRRYIRAKEKLIAALGEQIETAAEQAITGQIDVRTGRPYAAYKDSGVEWLPRVPPHWQRYRLKTLLERVDQRSSTGSETLLSLRRDHGVVVYADHFNRPPQAKSLVGFKLVAPGQLVVNRLQANNGLVFRSGLDGLVSPDYSVFRAKLSEQLAMRYLSGLLRTVPCRAHFRRESTGLGTGTAGFLRLYDDRLLATTVYLPTKAMQRRILDWIDLTTAKTTERVDHTARQIALLREYRQRLIDDTVTGNLDVRDAAAALPEVDPLADGPA